MLTTFAVGALAAAAIVQGTDTTVTVRPEARLALENHNGDVVVRAWDRNAVRIRADHDPTSIVEIDASPSVVHVHASSRRGSPPNVDFQITVPATVSLELSGVSSDVAVDGVRGAVTVETIQGDVLVRGGRGRLELSSVEGEVVVEDADGHVEVSSINQGVSLRNVRGDVVAETINGDVLLDGVQASPLDASTINGEIWFEGTIVDGGRYRFATHNGDVLLGVSPTTNAAVTVSTFNGDFESTFPVQLEQTQRGKRFDFTLGSGSARIDLESFQGSIRLVRPGEARADALEAAESERHHAKPAKPPKAPKPPRSPQAPRAPRTPNAPEARYAPLAPEAPDAPAAPEAPASPWTTEDR